MKSKKQKQFKDVSIKEKFNSNGSKWIKQSTRTAKLLENSRVFYFSQNEQVNG